MRPVALADLEVALCAVLAQPQDQRQKTVGALFAAAHAADLHRQTKGQPHPQFGTGTLMSAALQRPISARPTAYGPEQAEAFIMILNELTRFLAHHDH